VDSLSDLSEACEMGRTISYRATKDDDVDNVEDLTDWVSSREQGDDGVRSVAILAQGLGAAAVVGDMLQAIKDHAFGEHLVIVVIDPDQLADARRNIRTILGVHQALVPVCWQGIDPSTTEVAVIGQIVGSGRSNSEYLVDAISNEPYPHEIELYLDMGDDDDANLAAMDGMGQADFAALAVVRDGRLVSTLEDISIL